MNDCSFFITLSLFNRFQKNFKINVQNNNCERVSRNIKRRNVGKDPKLGSMIDSYQQLLYVHCAHDKNKTNADDMVIYVVNKGLRIL